MILSASKWEVGGGGGVRQRERDREGERKKEGFSAKQFMPRMLKAMSSSAINVAQHAERSAEHLKTILHTFSGDFTQNNYGDVE